MASYPFSEFVYILEGEVRITTEVSRPFSQKLPPCFRLIELDILSAIEP
jgi:hypothetical protein